MLTLSNKRHLATADFYNPDIAGVRECSSDLRSRKGTVYLPTAFDSFAIPFIQL
jgi:hypothetical protein